MSPPDPAAGQRLSVTGLRLELDEPLHRLPALAAERLGIATEKIRNWVILRRSLDARGRRKPRFEVRLGLELTPGVAVPDLPAVGPWPVAAVAAPEPLPDRCARPLVVGAGPAGLFAALRLRDYGVQALLLEQGDPVTQRVRRVARYWRHAELDEESNVQFGEGGAGTFSDGKLTYRGKDPAKQWVFEQLVQLGAPRDILFEAKPHLGTDGLRRVLRRLRAVLQGAGTQLHFRTRVERLVLEGDAVVGVETVQGPVRGSPVFLAPGHSSRRLISALAAQGVALAAKGFALGVRAEMLQQQVDGCQYGKWCGHPALPAAEFTLKARAGDGRDVYSFCMCPGGVVVPAGSEVGGLAVNGMSGSRRSSPWANAAIVVTVHPADFGHDPLAGFALQRRWEAQAHGLCATGRVPGQRLVDFVAGQRSSRLPPSNCPWSPQPVDLAACLPEFAVAALRQTLPRLQGQLPALAEAALLGVETRTSSPLRLLRDDHGRAQGLRHLYPVGEGAGYAGGIVSSAVDAVRAVDCWAAAGGLAAAADGSNLQCDGGKQR